MAQPDFSVPLITRSRVRQPGRAQADHWIEIVASQAQFRHTCPADANALGSFLKRFLSLTDPCPGYEVDDLNWKYWSPRDDWEGSRSYVLEADNGIEAHCGVLPARRHSTAGGTRGAHCIDWAADPRPFTA